MKTLCKVLLALLALFPVPALIWLALPQVSLLWPCRAYWRGYAVSLALTVPVVAGQLAVALAAAYGLTRWRCRARSSVLLLYCLLPLLPSQVMLLPNYLICRALGLLKNENAQGEYYLTDTPTILMELGEKVGVCCRHLGKEILGVNTPQQLSEVEEALLRR